MADRMVAGNWMLTMTTRPGLHGVLCAVNVTGPLDLLMTTKQPLKLLRNTSKTSLGLFGGAPEKTRVQPQPREDFDGSIRNELLRLLKLPTLELDDEPDPASTSVGQMFALILMRKAVKDQTLNAITEVLDRLEGKATKAAQNKPSNDHLHKQLDVSLDSLDELSENP